MVAVLVVDVGGESDDGNGGSLGWLQMVVVVELVGWW